MDHDFALINIFTSSAEEVKLLLLNPKIKSIICFSNSPQIKNQLLADLSESDLDRIVFETSEFSYQSFEPYKGGVIYLDSSKTTVNKELINKLSEEYGSYVSMIYVKFETDPNLSTKNTKSWTVEKGENYYKIIRAKQKYVEEFQQNKYGIDQSQNPNLLSNFRVRKLSWKSFCSKLTACDPTWDEQRKIKEYQKYIYQILINISPENIALEMVSEKYMPIWIQAVVHESYNLTANYETLETEGDSTLKYTMVKYLKKRFPHITSQGLTEYTNRYMSKEFQQIFSAEMKLPTWIYQDSIEMTIHIQEDLFESFIGAILIIGNQILENLGLSYIFNFITILLSDTQFDPKMILGKPKTQLQQRGDMLGIRDAKENNDEDEEEGRLVTKKSKSGGINEVEFGKKGEPITIRLVLTDQLKSFLLTELGKEFDQNLCSATADTSNVAKEKAWAMALDILERNGYTNDFAQDYKRRKSLMDIDASLVERCKAKALLAGINNLFLQYSKHSMDKNGNTSYILSGKDSDGITRKLAIARGINVNDARIKTLEKYLSS